MTTTDDKTPASRPTPNAADHPSDPKNKPLEELPPADLAKYVAGLPTKAHFDGMETEIVSILEKLAELSKKVEELFTGHTELAATVDGHGGELSNVEALLTEIATASRARGDQRDPAARQIPGLEVPGGVLTIDTTKVGKHETQLPSGGVVEVNVRRPGGGMLRDGKPTDVKKTRRS